MFQIPEIQASKTTTNKAVSHVAFLTKKWKNSLYNFMLFDIYIRSFLEYETPKATYCKSASLSSAIMVY